MDVDFVYPLLHLPALALISYMCFQYIVALCTRMLLGACCAVLSKSPTLLSTAICMMPAAVCRPGRLWLRRHSDLPFFLAGRRSLLGVIVKRY